MSKRNRRQRTGEERPSGAPAPDAPATDARSSGGAAPRPSRARAGLVLAMALLLAVALAAALRTSREQPASTGVRTPAPGPAIPVVDVSTMDAPVARAIGEARAELVRAPASADAWGKLAMVLDAHKQLAPAVTCYARAHELAPDEFRWAYLLALARSLSGDPSPQALAAFDEAIRLRPLSPLVHFHHGDLLLRRGELQAAREAYARALELDPDLALAHRSLGQVLVSLGEPRAAIEHLERARALLPADRFTHATLVRAYGLAGDEEKARALAAAAPPTGDMPVLEDPERSAVESLAVDPASSIDRAQRLIRAGKCAEALPGLKRFEAVSPDNATVQAQLGTCYVETGQIDLALAHLTRAVALKDDLPRAHIGLGYVHALRDEHEKAVEHYRRALELDPRNAAVLRELAASLAKTGRAREADEALARAKSLGAGQ